MNGLEGTNLGRAAALDSLTATQMRLTPVDDDGQPTGPSVTMPGPARVTLGALVDGLYPLAPTMQALAHAAAQAARAVAKVFGVPPGLLGGMVTLRDGRRVHVSMVRPGPARGVRASERRGTRRRHRRASP